MLDIFEGSVGILDAVSGDLLEVYGAYGIGPGLLKNPIDLLLTEGNLAIVTDKGSEKIEVYAIP